MTTWISISPSVSLKVEQVQPDYQMLVLDCEHATSVADIWNPDALPFAQDNLVPALIETHRQTCDCGSLIVEVTP